MGINVRETERLNRMNSPETLATLNTHDKHNQNTTQKNSQKKVLSVTES